MSENQQQVKVSKVGRKFAIGYQMGGEMTSDDWIEVISRYRESILEVYFAMPGDMSGRAPAGLKLEGKKTDELLEAFWNDLERLKAMDVSGVMLFNSACYGVENQSQKLLDHVGESIEAVRRHIDLKAVTTLHPAIAQYVKSHYPELKVRSSITMQIGTIPQMEAVADQFDGFYLHRDFNRDLEHINRPSPCCDVYTYTEKQPMLLQNTWIRPEDLHKVSGYFETVKLASRISPTILDIVKGYCEGEWHGNLLKLFEMDYSVLPFVPKIMNDKFPDGWFDQTMHCGHHCESCGYCRKVFGQVAEKTDFMEKKEG